MTTAQPTWKPSDFKDIPITFNDVKPQIDFWLEYQAGRSPLYLAVGSNNTAKRCISYVKKHGWTGQITHKGDFYAD